MRPHRHLASRLMHSKKEQSTPWRSVLYIEDNPTSLALVEQLIARRENLTLLSAATGHQGITLATFHLPDVILMDINLPDISGFEALRLLRKDPRTAIIPVIALSSDAHPKQIRQGIDAGFSMYLTKPFVVGDLMNAVDACLNAA